MANGRKQKGSGSNPNQGNDLSQYMADYLIDTPKILIDVGCVVEFEPGMKYEVNFRSQADQKELFGIIIHRSKYNIKHSMYELLVRHSIVLLRFEIDGPPHLNEGKVLVPCPHLHRYKEGYGARLAMPITNEFGDTNDLLACLRGFLSYCNVVQMPTIRPVRSLFP